MKSFLKASTLMFFGILIGAVLLYVYQMCNRPDLKTWHVTELSAEVTEKDIKGMSSLQEYLDQENILFQQLHEQLYKDKSGVTSVGFNRYLSGSWSDSRRFSPDWNRTIELPVKSPKAGILMLHGMSDSPYSMRALAETLHDLNCSVTVLRLPGHGTVPSGFVGVEMQDFTAAVRLAAADLIEKTGPDTPFYIVGYSNGATLALEYTMAEILGEDLRRPDGLVLISPSVLTSKAAALAKWHLLLARIPGLQKLAWLSIEPEYDPFKYNSFAINGGKLNYILTQRIQGQISKIDKGNGMEGFPPVVALQSVVDATTSPRALIDTFLKRLAPNGHELVLFDVNRDAVDMGLVKQSSQPIVEEMMTQRLPFTVSLVTNRDGNDGSVEIREKQDSTVTVKRIPTKMSWPTGIYSLSHVALPFPPTDPVYGMKTGKNFSLGLLEPKGEKGVLQIPASNLLRLRCNPFYDILEQKVISRIVSD